MATDDEAIATAPVVESLRSAENVDRVVFVLVVVVVIVRAVVDDVVVLERRQSH